MNDISVQNRLVKVENELKAQKTASELAYSSILFPENTPSATILGTIDFSVQSTARISATFQRRDGKSEIPFVDFAVDIDVEDYADWVESIGGTVSGRDPHNADRLHYIYCASVGNGAVEYYIDVIPLSNYGGLPVGFSATVEAISSVEGTLTLERIV